MPTPPLSSPHKARPETVISRRVRPIRLEEESQESRDPEAISYFREEHGWILVGDPGSGKSTTFEDEAGQTGGCYLTVADFLDLTPDPSWRDGVLFLDGFDEAQALDGRTTIRELRKRLSELGYPRFRVACRAWDWRDATFREDLGRLAPGGLQVLALEPLQRDEILQILADNHGIQDAEAFLGRVASAGFEDWLGNPLNLELLVKAQREGAFPSSRAEAFDLGCEALAQEQNQRHMEAQRDRPCSLERILDAAGHLFAVILLANLHGVALSNASRNRRFEALAEFRPDDTLAAELALKSRLFRQHGVDRLLPLHRTVAEYLAGRYLARRIDAHGLSSSRFIRMLVATDGRSVAGLRGLFGWLSTFSVLLGPRLRRSDPVAILAYGDLRQLPPQGKREVLHALRSEAEINPAFHWKMGSDQIFADLASVELIEDLREILNRSERTDAHESHIICLMYAMEHGSPVPGLDATLWGFVEDNTHWQRNRRDALEICLKSFDDPVRALQLLEKIHAGTVMDENDDLLGTLLKRLYPGHLGPKELLQHVRPAKNSNYLGPYDWFVGHELAQIAPDAHIPELLEALVDRPELEVHYLGRHKLFEMAEALLIRGLEIFGESIPNSTLLRWFSMGRDPYVFTDRTSSDYRKALDWLGAHPDRYKDLLLALLNNCREDPEASQTYWHWIERIKGAAVPSDLGRWHLELAGSDPTEAIAHLHLEQAFHLLWADQGAEGLTLEALFSWASSHPERRDWITASMTWPIQPWHQEQVTKKKLREAERFAKRNESFELVQSELPDIRNGTAISGQMRQMAFIWMGRFFDAQGSSPSERFHSIFEPGEETFLAAQEGLLRCLDRSDIPHYKEIIEAWINGQEYHLELPCLISMDLRWEQDSFTALALDPPILRSLVAFLAHYFPQKVPAWFLTLCRTQPELVAEVLVEMIQAGLEKGEEHILCLQWLCGGQPSIPEVSKSTLPLLLGAFPGRNTSSHAVQLQNILRSAFDRIPHLLPRICDQQLESATEGMAPNVRLLWLMAGAVFNPHKGWQEVWELVDQENGLVELAAEFSSCLLAWDGLQPDHIVPLLSGLVERLAPLSSPTDNWEGSITPARNNRDQVRGFLSHLGRLECASASRALEHLLSLTMMEHFEFQIRRELADQRARMREVAFEHLNPRQAVQVLSNGTPTTQEDLLRLVMDHMADISEEVQHGNADGFRAFWDGPQHALVRPREENLCRDQILIHLRHRLSQFDIDCQPEADYARDRRADIRVSLGVQLALPIEIKRENHPELWTAINEQLIPRYTQDPLAKGHGIYLAIWFGQGDMPLDPLDRKKPATPGELKARLEAQIPSEERHRVMVHVMDVSLKATPGPQAPPTRR